MRLALAALTLLATLSAAAAQASGSAAAVMDGPVAGGAFGPGGADYYGEVRDGPPPATRRSAGPVARGRRPARKASRPDHPPRR